MSQECQAPAIVFKGREDYLNDTFALVIFLISSFKIQLSISLNICLYKKIIESTKHDTECFLQDYLVILCSTFICISSFLSNDKYSLLFGVETPQ